MDHDYFVFSRQRRQPLEHVIVQDHQDATMDVILAEHLIIDPNDCDTRLHRAALGGNVNLMKTILKNEPQMRECINMQVRPLGTTPLRLAATGGHVDAIKFLLENGVKVDKPDVKQQTPLFVAIRNQHIECSRALLEGCANPNGAEGNMSTPLYIATQNGFTDEVLLLLKYGADTEPFCRNCTNFTGGSSPLHAAVVYSLSRCYKALLAAGAEPDLRKLKIPIPDFVIQRLSLIHSIVRYHPSDSKEFVQLFVLFGGYLWQRNCSNQLATDLEMSSDDRLNMNELMGKPLKLGELCRISLRRAIGRERLHLMSTLPLPQTVIDFLLYKDIIDESLLIYK